MRQFFLGIATAGALVGVVALSRSESSVGARLAPDNELKIESGDKNPWTSLKLNNDPDQFQFAVVSDRTGGHRDKIFSQAVARVNLLQPEFVMSVGDLIEGYTTKEETIKKEWDEFDNYTKRFEMPFFYVPGNHDLTNKTMVTKWGERYGKRYYHFTYKNVLFLCLCSENPPDMGTIDKEQQEWVSRTLEANKDVRWTFVFLHKPIWTAKDLDKNGWGAVEKSLAGRKYNVFCGHVHRYQRFERNGMQYYQLATTGGGSKLRGVEYGEFDHVAWITMKQDAPLIANVMLDGILPHDLKTPESDEKGVPVKKKPTFPVSGTITLSGTPVPGATVALHTYNAERKVYTRVADGRTDEVGRFQLTTYAKFDGVPAGDYIVTVTGGEKSTIPEMYTAPAKSPLKVPIRETPNTLLLDLIGK
ncbi:MAG: metallophosphoesterase [Planctomycetia bacterium]|nr:metallophosphoesterase [Planctomycetia bacterium]